MTMTVEVVLKSGPRRVSAVLGAAAFVAMVCLPPEARAEPRIGEPAPAFTGTTSDGSAVALEAYRGRVVVLEWTNHECPYTQKHYDAGAMQALQKEAADEGVVWFSIVSSAPGRQGYVTGQEADRLTRSRDAAPTAVILDPAGSIGRAYDAKTTPHMYIVDAAGTLVYMGAIDDDPSARGDPATARNHVRDALAQVLAGAAVATAVTQPYGCTIKYGG